MSRDRTYWRSLEELAGDTTARDFLEREFPPGASEAPEGLTRRNMLALLGASLSLAGLTACRRPVEKIVPFVTAPEEFLPGVPLGYATTLPQGHNAFGVVVESHEGRPTKIEGNDLHPATRGASHVWLQASVLSLYDPDRSGGVRRGSETATWDDFVAAWTALEPAHLADGGARLAVLVEPFSSPTLARLAEAFRLRFPAARFVAWDPVSDENAYRGVAAAAGAPYHVVHRLERARVIASLDADFLLTGTDAVRDGASFAEGRRVAGPDDSMSRLYAVEGCLSLTGANADHRLRLASRHVGGFVAALAAALSRRGLAVQAPGAAEPPPGAPPAFIEALATDLLEHRGAGAILAGRRQPPEVHAAVLALNAALGNVGTTVMLHETRDARRSDRRALEGLVGELRGGTVDTLVMLGGNPVYTAPVDLDFAEALGAVEHSVHLASHVDETSRACSWHVNLAHALESWGDARSLDGTPSVIQPLIEPLFGGKTAVELLGLLAGKPEASGYDMVRETWRPRLGAEGFEAAWNRVLHDGVQTAGALPAAAPAIDGAATAALGSRAGGADGLEVVFCESPSVFDGRFANNGWLQELPDPVTKLTWDNAAMLSPATATRLGLANGDLVRVELGGRAIELPAWQVPGQADESVVLELGYGRDAGGRIAKGTGADAYRLRTLAAGDFATGAQIGAVGGNRELAQTQDHGVMMGRPIVREASLEAFHENPGFAAEMVEHPPLEQLWAANDYTRGPQWGMAIDLNACTGCNACVVACQSENNIPIVGRDQVRRGREMHWLRIDRYFTGAEVDHESGFGERPELTLSDPAVVFQPVPCMHCENAPCEQVCPVAATVHDAEGLNTMVYNRCIGTRYCSNNCPYKVRRFNFYNFTKDTSEIQKMVNNPDVTVRSRGVMEKCTYCTQRINASKIQAKLDGRELRDGDVRTACQQACPSRAISFGDITDDESAVARTKRQPRNYALLAELNNRPRTTYLAKLRNRSPALGGGEASGGHA